MLCSEPRPSRFMLLLLLCAGRFVPAYGHSMYQAAVLLDFQGTSLNVELQLPVERMETALGLPMTPQVLERERARVIEYILRGLSATCPDGRSFRIEAAGSPVLSSIDGAPYVVAHLRATPPAHNSADLFELHSEVLLDRIPSQVALVSLRSDWRTSTFANDPKLVGVLRSDTRSVAVDRRNGSWFHGFGSVFQLGMRHIADGTDHLLFLLVLLLPAPLLVSRGRWAGYSETRRCLWQIGKIVTAFTAGHSVTLGLGAWALVQVPSRPIEVLIAVSILVSAVHALRPLFPGREALIAFSFGLVHGLAFATTLAELGLGRWERVASIFGFNLGIEVMQLVVVAAAMPSLLLLSRTRLYVAIRIPAALFGAVAAAGWIAERLVSAPNPMDAVVTALAQRAVFVAIGLTLPGAVAWSHTKLRSKPHKQGRTTADAGAPPDISTNPIQHLSGELL
jgi:hypothetical protein